MVSFLRPSLRVGDYFHVTRKRFARATAHAALITKSQRLAVSTNEAADATDVNRKSQKPRTYSSRMTRKAPKRRRPSVNGERTFL